VDGVREDVDATPTRPYASEILKSEASGNPRRSLGKALVGDTSDDPAWRRRQ
jgi:hypothetical protein